MSNRIENVLKYLQSIENVCYNVRRVMKFTLATNEKLRRSKMFCGGCGKQLRQDMGFCPGCGRQQGGGQPSMTPQQPVYQNTRTRCPKCGHGDIQFISDTQSRNRSVGSWLFWIIIAVLTFGIGLIFLFFMGLTNKKHLTKTRAVCKNCTYQWGV